MWAKVRDKDLGTSLAGSRLVHLAFCRDTAQMRGRWYFAFLVLGCARPPSARPLGGEEWVREEPIADRKPHGDAVSPKAVASIDSGAAPKDVSAAVAPAPPSPSGPPTKPGDIEFKFEPLAKGTTVRVDTRVKLDATFGSDSAIAEGNERMDVRVLDASAEGVREIEVLYVKSESSFRYAGGNEQSSKSGKRYRVRFGGASPEVQLLDKGQGSDDEDEDDDDPTKGVIFDLGTVTGYVPLLRRHLPATLHAPWRMDVSPEQVTEVFGKADSARLDRGWLALRGVASGTAPVADFDCGVPIHLGRDGLSFSVELTGHCKVRPQDSRPVEISVSGPLRVESTAVPGIPISGRFEAQVTHTYSR